MQCPYYVHKALVKLFDFPEDRIRVIQTETGGGFGGKEEYPSLITGHAALLAWKSGKPVKLIYDRAEDMVATTKRHPSRTRHKTAVTKDGKLLAMEIEFVIDGGAYCTLSPVVLSRGTIHAAGPYFCPNVRIRSRRWRRTCRRMARFAVLARRKVSSRWNGTWTTSPARWDSRRKNFGGAISFTKVKQQRRVRRFASESISMACSIARCNSVTITRNVNVLRSRMETGRSAESVSRRLCMARGYRVWRGLFAVDGFG